MTSEEQEKNFPQAINERLQVITLGLSSFSFNFLKARGFFFYISVYFAVNLLMLLQRSKEKVTVFTVGF